MLTVMGFNEGGATTPVSGILKRLDLLVKAIERNEDVRYKLNYAAASNIKFPEDRPFRYDHAKQELGLKRAASEEEIIWAFRFVSGLTLVNGDAHANDTAKAELRVKLTALCQQPIADLLFLRPIYPNQRELRLRLVDNTDPRKEDDDPTGSDGKETGSREMALCLCQAANIL
ncbi:hypothetical protein ACVWXO_000419 [Bradyrhizobium sp. LM2.7]